VYYYSSNSQDRNKQSLGQTMLHFTKSEGHFRPNSANNSGVLATGWWVGIHIFLF